MVVESNPELRSAKRAIRGDLCSNRSNSSCLSSAYGTLNPASSSGDATYTAKGRRSMYPLKNLIVQSDTAMIRQAGKENHSM